MGPACCHGRGAIEEGIKTKKTWVNISEKYLAVVLGSEEDSIWYHEVRIELRSCSSSNDSRYTQYQRWRKFWLLDHSSPHLKFQPGECSDGLTTMDNLFDMLWEDFHDGKNPIAAIIQVFMENYCEENTEPAAKILRKKAKSEADRLVSEMSSVILKFVKVLDKVTEEFYSSVSIVWQRNKRDLDGLLLSVIVSGPMFDLLLKLAAVACTDDTPATESLDKSRSTEDEACFDKSGTTPAMDVAVSDISARLSALCSSLIVHRHRLLLTEIDHLLAAFPSDCHKSMLARSAQKANEPSLPVLVYLDRQLLQDPPSSLCLLMCSP